LSSHGFIKGDRVLKTMKEFIPDANIEDLKIKYTATAFDLAQNKEIVFSRVAFIMQFGFNCHSYCLYSC